MMKIKMKWIQIAARSEAAIRPLKLLRARERKKERWEIFAMKSRERSNSGTTSKTEMKNIRTKKIPAKGKGRVKNVPGQLLASVL